jgi:cold shock CspA family protein
MTESTETQITGKITKLHERGWGFITSQEKKFTRIFFHWSALEQDTLNFTQLRVGMRVTFYLKEFPDRGFRAVKMRVLPREDSHDIQREV